MSKPFIEFGLRLEKIRLGMRYTQQEFADFAEISLRCYQNYERGEREVSATALKNLAIKIDLSPLYILNGKEPVFVE